MPAEVGSLGGHRLGGIQSLLIVCDAVFPTTTVAQCYSSSLPIMEINAYFQNFNFDKIATVRVLGQHSNDISCHPPV